MSCLRIIANNLDPLVSERLAGAKSADLDVPFTFSIRKSKNVERLKTTKDIEIEGILRFDLDFTPTNNAVFSEYETPTIFNREDTWIDVTVIEDGAGLNFNRLFVVGKDDSRKKWIVELLRPADHWADTAPEKKINTIDCGTFQVSKSYIIENWGKPAYDWDYTPYDEFAEGGRNPAYYWPVIDYGNVVDQQPPHSIDGAPRRMIAVEDLRPLVNFNYLLVRGFCEIGWKLEGSILESEYSRRIWLYLLKENYYIGSGGYDGGTPFGYAGKFTARRTTDQTLSFNNSPILANKVEFSFSTNGLQYQGGANYLCGIKNNFPFWSQFTFRFQFSITNNNANPLKAGFVIGEVDPDPDNDIFTGEYLCDFQHFDLGAGTTDFLIMEFEATLEPGQKACLLHDSAIGSGDKILTGLWCSVTHNNKCISRNDFVDFRTILRDDVSLMDLFKAYLHCIQGRYVSNAIEKTLTVYPRQNSNVHGTAVAGFIKDQEPSVNIDDIVVKDSFITTYVRRDLPRYTRFQFADSKDAYIADLELTEPAHSRKILNGYDLKDETEEYENVLFEPTLEGQWEESNFVRPVGRSPFPFIPRLWDNTDGERSFDIGPRIFYAFGYVKQINPDPFDKTLQGGEHAAFLFDGYTNPTDAVTQFGYVTQLRTWLIDPTPTIDGSVVFGTAPNDLYSTFWLGFGMENRGGALIDMLLYMKQSFYSSIDFRDLYLFNYLGRPITGELFEVNDFTACDDVPTQVKMYIPPVTSKCCDGPCSCQYLTCEYYFDLGVYITQNTLDQLYISSFKVNDIEQLTNNVEFSDLDIVTKKGLPYVMNMVNALNSIAVPYFFFEPSLREHPEKGMRYFKLKRPRCYSFVIEITYIGTVVYRYTELVQETNWFGGGFADMGYGSAYHGAPIDCIATQEF